MKRSEVLEAIKASNLDAEVAAVIENNLLLLEDPTFNHGDTFSESVPAEIATMVGTMDINEAVMKVQEDLGLGTGPLEMRSSEVVECVIKGPINLKLAMMIIGTQKGGM